MTKENIIRMAREAGLHRQQHNLMSNPVQYRFSYEGYEENLERFAALVAAAERQKMYKRRGTVMFDPYCGTPRHPSDIESDPHAILLLDPEQPIRARGETK